MLNDSTYSAMLKSDVASEYLKLMENYVSILEKTNQQLGMWSNPYGVAVGILSIFIAVIAIGVAIALWLNSREQKDRFNKFLDDQEKIIKLKNERLEQVETKLDKLIKGYEKQLESATKDNKKEIEKAIADLKKEKASIGAYITPAASLGSVSRPTIGSLNSTQGISLYTDESIICTNCGKRFTSGKNNLLNLGSVILNNRTVYCSFCGSPNII